MSALDDKRFILEDGIQSFAYGQYSPGQTSTFGHVLFGSTDFSFEHCRFFQYCLDGPHVHSELSKTTAVLADDDESETHSTTSSSTSLNHFRAENVSAAYCSPPSSTAIYCTPLSTFHFA